MRSKLLLTALFALTVSAARAVYMPVPITSGFTADVIGNGIGTAGTVTTADVDGAGYRLVAVGWQLNASSTPLAFGLPANGIINSAVAATPGLTFNLAPYSSNNSLRIATNIENTGRPARRLTASSASAPAPCGTWCPTAGAPR